MIERVIQKLREGPDVARLVVDPGEESVLEEQLAAGLLDVVSSGVH